MYSDDEIDAVVSQLVRTEVRRDYDDLGVRRTDLTFSDIQEVAASVFMLYPSTPYYLAYLSENKIRGAIESISISITDVLNRMAILRRRSLPVRDLSSLVNAQVALLELESSSSSNVQNTPAWKRVDSNFSRFLTRVGSNVKLNGDIVVTPEQARIDLPALLTALNTQAIELKRVVTLLSNAVSDYNKIDLAKYSRDVITNARLLLTDTIDAFNAVDDAGKLALLRDAVLKVLAMKGVVRDYGTFTGVTPLVLTGTATPFSDNERPAVGALLELGQGPYDLNFGTGEDDSTNAFRLSTNVSGSGVRYENVATSANSSPNTTFTRSSGSFITDGVIAGDLVDILVGPSLMETRRVQSVTALMLTCSGPTLLSVGTVTIRVVRAGGPFYLASSYVGKLEGLVSGPYNITAGLNDSLQFSIDGAAPVTVPLTPGMRTATQIVIDLDSVLVPFGYEGEAYFSPLYFDGVVTTLGNNLSTPFGNFPLLFSIGDEVDIYFGDNAATTRVITALLPSPSAYNTITIDGAVLLTSAEDRIRVGSPARKVRVAPSSSLLAVSTKSSIKLVLPTTLERSAGLTLGFFGEVLTQSRPTDAASLVTSFNSNSKAAIASVRDEPVVVAALVRTVPSNVSRLVIYKQRVTASYGAGTNVTFTLDEPVVALVSIGDTLVLREGLEPDTQGLITAVTDTTVTATMGFALTAATSQVVEIGETSLFSPDDTIVIPEGRNEGRYYIDTVFGPPFEVTLRGNTVPFNRDNFNEPVLMTGAVVREGVNLQSKTLGVADTLEVYDPLHIFFTTDGPHQATAQTQYLTLPSTKGVVEGDVLELYTTGSVTPDILATVVTVFEDAVVGLDVAIDATVSYTMAEGRPQAAPSAVLRKSHPYDFDTFQGLLGDWLAQVPWRDLPAYFIDLNRFVNPLLVNENPTDADVGAAEAKIKTMAGTLTIALATSTGQPTLDSLEAIFNTYTVDRVHEVDAMLKTLQERGADRAVDLLLECQFQAFFGVTLEDASYGGAFQKAMRNVLQSDLPVNKIRRVSSSQGNVAAEVIDTDYEYSLDDIDNTVTPDPPVYNTD